MHRSHRTALARPFGSLLLIALLLLAYPGQAQDRLDPVSMGKARASVASVRGLGSVVANPGALALDRLDRLTLEQPLVVSIYTLGGSIGSTYFSGDRFREIFGERPEGLTNEQRQKLGDLLQDEKLFANGGINLLTVRYVTEESGTFGLQYGHRLVARVNFPGEFRDLLRTGNLAENYEFVNRGIGVTWSTQLGFSYGTVIGTSRTGWLPSAGVGATLKLVQGVAHFEIQENSILSTSQIEAGGAAAFLIRGGYTFRSATPEAFDLDGAVGEFQTALFPGTSGLGVGVDLGISGTLFRKQWSGNRDPLNEDETTSEAITWGIVLQDVGTISWSTNAYERRLDDVRDTLRTASLTNEQFRRFEGTLTRVPDFSTPLASVLRAGLGFDLGALLDDRSLDLRLDLEGEAPLNDVPGNPEGPRIAIGADWGASDHFRVRTGLSLLNTSDSTSAVEQVGSTDQTSTSSVGVGLGLGWRPLDWLSIDVGSGDVAAIVRGETIDLSARLAAALPWK